MICRVASVPGAIWQAEIHQDHVRSQRKSCRYRFLDGTHQSNDLNVALLLEDSGQVFAEQVVIIDDDDSHLG